MTNHDDPAFPVALAVEPSGDIYRSDEMQGGAGLTKRELFAAMAMQGLLSGAEDIKVNEWHPEVLAQSSIRAADALIMELQK